MPWGSTPAGDVIVRGTGWFGEVQPDPTQLHGQGWTGIKKITAPQMVASALLRTPSAKSGSTIFVPGGGTGLPLTLPFMLGGSGASMQASAVFREALMGNGFFAVSAPKLTASAAMYAPSVVVGIVVHVPAYDPLPNSLPFAIGPQPSMYSTARFYTPFVEGVTRVDAALMAATAQMYVPDVSAATPSNTVPSPLMQATADLYEPTVTSSALVNVPAYDEPLPLELPFILGPQPSLHSVAEFGTPVVGTNYTVSAPPMGSTADLYEPTSTSDAQPRPPRMAATAAVNATTPSITPATVTPALVTATAAMLTPAVTVTPATATPARFAATAALYTPSAAKSASLTVPLSTATAAMATPVVSSGVVVSAPLMGATADILDPGVGVVTQAVEAPRLDASAQMFTPTGVSGVVASPPAMAASASAPTPVVTTGATVTPPVMEAHGDNEPLPQSLPFDLEIRVGFFPPAVSVSQSVSVPLSTSTAATYAPTATSGASLTEPRMAATAAMYTPTVTLTPATVSVPRMAASAAANAPTAQWTKAPETTSYPNSGSFDVTAAKAAGFTHLVLVGIGGGEAGTNGSFITGTGGDQGSWNSNASVVLASLPSLTTITITVGNAGASNGANGAATTFVGNAGGGLTTVSCAGGSGGTGAWNGGNAGNVTVDGDLYTGGAGGAGVSGQVGGVPGGGGAGGPVFSAGAAGGKGQAWVKAKRIP